MVSLGISENIALAARFQVERMTGIEPALSAWEADVLPLNYIRRSHRCLPQDGHPCFPCVDMLPELVLAWAILAEERCEGASERPDPCSGTSLSHDVGTGTSPDHGGPGSLADLTLARQQTDSGPVSTRRSLQPAIYGFAMR
jgi:hypothetical protein